MSPLFFISRSRSLSPFFSLSFLVNTLDKTDTETISAFRFSLYSGSLVISALQDGGGYSISHQNNLELHLGCHTCWLSYFTLVWLWCGRTVARAIFSDGYIYFIFLPMVLRWRASARELRYYLREFDKD